MSDDLRKQVIRLAHAKPELRAKLLPLLEETHTAKTAGSPMRRETWNRVLNDTKRAYMEAIGEAAVEAARDEGFTNIKWAMRSYNGLLTAVRDEGAFHITFGWDGEIKIKGYSEFGRKKHSGSVVVLSMSPEQVAAEFFYEHMQGLVP